MAHIWLLLAAMVSFGVTVATAPIIIRLARWLDVVDTPDGVRRFHAEPVPRLGGVSVYLGAAIACAVALTLAGSEFLGDATAAPGNVRFLIGAASGSAIMWLAGLWDDIRGLRPGAKLLAQVTAATVAYYMGARVGAVALGYGIGVDMGILSLPLVIIWIVAVTNAFNFVDGINGLAGGLGVVALLAAAVAAFALGNSAALLPAVVLAVSLVGFLRFNYPRARIFLGDSGSMTLGFMVAVLMLKAAQNEAGAVVLAVPLLAVFVPLLDLSLAVLRRSLRGVPLSGADAEHLHHRFLALGLTSRRTTQALWVLASGMAAVGLLIALTAPYVATTIAIAGLAGLTVLLIYGSDILAYPEFKVASDVLLSGPSRLRRLVSDHVIVLNAKGRLAHARTPETAASILAVTGESLGFLRLEIRGGEFSQDAPQNFGSDVWAWKLEYPLRSNGSGSSTPRHTLAIWCSAENDVRPFGAERAARSLAPAVEEWLRSRAMLASSREHQRELGFPPPERQLLPIERLWQKARRQRFGS